MKYLLLIAAFVCPLQAASTALDLIVQQQSAANPNLQTGQKWGWPKPAETGTGPLLLGWTEAAGTSPAKFMWWNPATGIVFDTASHTVKADMTVLMPRSEAETVIGAMEAEIAAKAATSYVDAGLAGKMNTLIGSASQYLAGNGALITFPTIPTVPTDLGAFTNSPGFITSSSSSLTWPNISGKPATFTPSAHTHSISEVDGLSLALADKADTSTVNAGLALKANASDVSAGLALKVDKVAGKGLSSEDYTTAEKTKLSGLSAQVQSDWNASSGLGVILNKPTISTKRRETYTVTTNSSGLGTVTFGTAFAVAPSISAEPTSFTSDNQFCRVTSITTTGFTVTCRLRTDVIGLLPSFSNISGATVEVLITEK